MINMQSKGASLAANIFLIFAVIILIVIVLWRLNLVNLSISSSYNTAPKNIYPSKYEFKPVKDMVFVPAGVFHMGSSDGEKNEQPAHRVSVNSFWMDKYEVTNKEYEKFDPKHKQYRKNVSIKDDEPVIHVTWFDANNYCDWRCDVEKVPRGTYRLPTEAEWEYAARGGLKNKSYPWGNFPPDIFGFKLANYKSLKQAKNIPEKCMPVGSFSQNGYGLCDIAGNVREWCSDWYGDYSGEAPNSLITNPHGKPNGTKKVWRGGSWGSNAESLRCSSRGGISPGHWLDNLGFRCVRVQ